MDASRRAPARGRGLLRARGRGGARTTHRSAHPTISAAVQKPSKMTGAITSTLRHVTDRKLAKLAEHQDAFEAHKARMLQASASETDRVKKVRILMDGHKHNKIKYNISEASKYNVAKFVRQAEYDPSVSPVLLDEWRAWLEQNLDIHTDKYNYADLFGRLVTEWIENPSDATRELNAFRGATEDAAAQSRSDSPSAESDSFDVIGREEMHEQRKTLEQFIFKETPTNAANIKAYLDSIFVATHKAKKLQKTPLERLREQIGAWDGNIAINEAVIRWAIKALLRADQFTGQKREALVDLQSRSEVIKEMVDILRMDLDSVHSWEWPSAIPIQMRRQLNGKYRAYMDEEIHTAIFLQIIGTHFAVMLKNAFTMHFNSGAWVQAPFRAMGKRDMQRRHYFLGKENVRPGGSHTVREMRRSAYLEDYFLTQLPSQVEEGNRDYNDDGSTDDENTKTPLEIKQSLLRLATTEMLLNTKLYGEFTILTSDFKWFGPSLPHSSIYAVLEYLNVRKEWVAFVKKFLEAPLVFPQDGPNAETRVRKNGIPMSLVLSDALGEALLFCLDFAVNRKTNGACLYRFHDDIFFWGQESKCVQAWNALQEFASVMGMHLNEEKTAAAKIIAPGKGVATLHKALPAGTVRWGFLKLDPKEGKWVIDQEQVDEHTKELRRQLDGCRSVLAWVQAWNSYVARFFTNNFGEPAYCLGRPHLNMVIETLARIQRTLFAESGGAGNVIDHLRSVITERFSNTRAINDGKPLPDAFFYLPVELGGLGLLNPFVQPFSMHENSPKNTMKKLDDAILADEEEYENLKERFESGELPEDPAAPKFDKEPFMSLEEYTRFSEQTSVELATAYHRLMRTIHTEGTVPTPEIDPALEALRQDDGAWNTPGFKPDWDEMSLYWKWVVSLYAGEATKRFGGLAICEKGLLPLGLVSILRSERVRWQG